MFGLHISFDIEQLNKIFRKMHEEVYLDMVDDFPELDATLNINKINPEDE